MDSMKKFLDKNALPREYRHIESGEMLVSIKDLGLFYWEELIILYKRLKYTDKQIVYNIEIYLETKDMKLVKDLPENTDRLLTRYALACLGENKIKELIKDFPKA